MNRKWLASRSASALFSLDNKPVGSCCCCCCRGGPRSDGSIDSAASWPWTCVCIRHSGVTACLSSASSPPPVVQFGAIWCRLLPTNPSFPFRPLDGWRAAVIHQFSSLMADQVFPLFFGIDTHLFSNWKKSLTVFANSSTKWFATCDATNPQIMGVCLTGKKK